MKQRVASKASPGASVDGIPTADVGDAARFFSLDRSIIARQLGKLGGEKTKQTYGPDHYKRMGQISARKRWGTARGSAGDPETRKS